MGTLTIRNIDDDVKQRLRRQAATRGVSMEEEARLALRSWVRAQASWPDEGLGSRLHRRFKELGGFEFDDLPRGSARPLPDIFEE